MAWTGVWSLKIDGAHELIDPTGIGIVTQIPEWDTGSDDDVILVPIDGSPPAYIRNQPKEGVYTILIASLPCGEATWSSKLATIRSWLSRGPHTLTAQIRGMAAPATVTVVVRGTTVGYTERRVAVTCVVPDPYQG